MQYFVTGTDTDAGKTVASAVLCKALNSDYWKPIQSGLEATDSSCINLFAPNIKIHKEAYKLTLPLSPHIAAVKDSIKIECDKIRLPISKKLIAEGAGGLLVPLTENELQIDLIKQLNIPCILVVRHRVGSINHTLLSLEAIKARNIPLAGVLYNGNDPADNESIIQRFHPHTNLGCIQELHLLNPESIETEALRLRPELLKKLGHE